MHPWKAEPLWAFFDRLIPPGQITTSDVLTVIVTEYAHLPRRKPRHNYLSASGE